MPRTDAAKGAQENAPRAALGSHVPDVVPEVCPPDERHTTKLQPHAGCVTARAKSLRSSLIHRWYASC
jgi:hypothetical protein